MEGERILQCIKDGTNMGDLVRDLEIYMAPFMRQKSSTSQELASKFGLYSMKVLRACVQQLTALKTGHSTISHIICIANKSYECISKAKKHTATVSLSLEKLLFHMMVQGMTKGFMADAMVFARNLYEHLGLCQRDFITDGEGVDSEYDAVCKQAFNQLWKACVDLEHSSKQGTKKHMVVLDVRLQALTFLMLTSYEVSWVVERALRAMVEFDRVSSNSIEENNQTLQFLKTVLDTLQVDCGEAKKENVHSMEVSELLSPMFELSLQLAWCCSHLGKPEEALTQYEKLEKVVSRCSETLYTAAVSIITATLHLSVKSSSKDVSKSTKKAKSQRAVDLNSIKRQILDAVNSTSKVVEKGKPNHVALQCLIKALEFLKKRFEYITNQRQDSSPNLPSSSMVPDELIPAIEAALSLLIDLLQLQRQHMHKNPGDAESASKGKQQRLLLQKAVNRQLAALNLMSVILLHRMKHCREDIGDDAGRIAEDALSVCQRTLRTIEEVSGGAGGAVSTNEHRWLGTNAYNFGLMCYKNQWYTEAVPLLTMACQQLQRWCVTKEVIDKDKITKVQLFSKYELLVDCHRKAGQNREAMQTAVDYLWEHASHLTDQLTAIVEMFVKAKRDAVKSTGDDELRTRTVFDAIQAIEGTIPDESTSLVSKLLELELSIYKSQRYETTVEQYAVVCDLLGLYGDDKMRLHRAHAHIEQAQLLRDGSLETDCSPVDCCKEAIQLLEDLAQDFLQQQEQQQDSSKDYLVVFDLLATAYFWLYICDSEANQATYISTQFIDSKPESIPEAPDSTTSKKHSGQSADNNSIPYTLSAEYLATEPLDQALDIWSDLMADGCNTSMFNDPVSTCYCLKVAASLCHLADRPIQQIQALCLLVRLAITNSSHEDAILAYCQMTQALCQLGAVAEAETLLSKAHGLMRESKADGEDSNGLDVALMITECYVLLGSHKIREFESLLGKVLQLQSNKHRSRQTYLRNASIKHLQALYLLLPNSQRTQDAAVYGDLIPDDLSPLELRAEAMRLQMGVGRLMLGEGIYSNEQNLHCDGLKHVSATDSGCSDVEFDQWTVMTMVLQSLYEVSSLYLEQGCIREAKSYLKEGLLLAEKFMLPRWCVAFLLQLSNLYAQCGQENDCEGSLSKVHVILHVPNEGSRPGRQDASSVAQEDDDDDDFIHTKRISISSECSSRTLLVIDTTSSPALRAQTVKLPGYISHASDCFCVSCLDLSLHVQNMRLFLRRAQCLELQGESTQAMTHLQAALDHGAWATKKIPALLTKSCSPLQSCESATNKKGKRQEVPKADANSRHYACNIHTEAILEAHVSLTVLNLLNGSLVQAEGVIQKGLDLTNHASIHRSWLQYFEILISLEREAERAETTAKDLLSSHWEVQSTINSHRESRTQDEDLALQFEGLGLGKPCSKAQTQFQDLVFADRMQRPEVSRKLSEKVSELGIFCDMSDSDNSDKTSTVESYSMGARKPVVKETPKTVTLNTKKGALMCSVRKKKPVRNIWNDIVTPQADAASTSVFDFDGPSPVKTKKAGKTAKSSAKSKSTRRKVAIKTIDLDSDVDEVFDKEIETIVPKTATRTKRTTAKKPSSKVQLDNDSENSAFLENVDHFIENVDASKSVRKSRKATEVNVDSTRKTRKVRKPPADTELPEPKVVSARPKRGRKPNVETLRSEVMTQVTFDIMSDLQLPCLELDSPDVNSSTTGSNNHGSLDFNFEISTPGQTSQRTEQPSSPVSGTTNSLILEDLDEIEIPRAGRGSDSDEPLKTVNIRRKTARKPAASRKRTTKKCVADDVEVLRGANTTPVDAKTVTGKTRRQAASAGGSSSELSLTHSGSSVEAVISTLEQIHSSVCHLAPTLLYRRVCQLLAMCLSDRHPERAAYYLSEATAVTLRHQKLSSLAKKIKKQKKKVDSDGVQMLPDAMATMMLDGDGKDGCREKMDLQHLTEEQALFSFNRNPTQGESIDVVQQIRNVLPEGWTVCIMSVVSSSVSPTGTLTDSDSLLMCRLSRGCEPVIVNHSMPSTSLGSASGLLEEFTNILSESKSSVKETDKKAWWTCRQQLDERTRTLTEAMEETLLGQWKGLVLGARTNPEERQRLSQASEKLKTLIETMCKKQVDLHLCQSILESSSHLSKLQLHSALSSLSGAIPGSDQHVSLVSSFRHLVRDWSPATGREPVILILDKQIQQLPWESIPILQDGAVCRMPSLYFILAQLLRSPGTPVADGLDPTDAFFVLNPSNDLASTQKTFQKWFEKENNWKGVVARPPTKEEYKLALTDHQLFVFCGHGNGREFLTGDDIQRLNCRATSLLIGCSSGRLHVTGAQEASGMVLNYLVAECPCLVANLWDVTDRDIDRFLEQLLRSWLASDGSSSKRSLLDYMSEARRACKLQHLIGASPVVYGLPVCLNRKIDGGV